MSGPQKEGRSTLVTELPDGTDLADSDDLAFFRKKLERGVSIPTEFLKGQPEDDDGA